MAEMIALGISHYPPLTGHDDRMAWILQRMLQNPSFPRRSGAREGGPSRCRPNGATITARQPPAATGRASPLAAQGARRARRVPPRLRADLGRRPVREFSRGLIPPYCISAHDSFRFSPPANNVWNETDRTFELAGNRAAAKMLASRLLEQGFDVAYSYKPLHHPIGHAFANGVMYLDYDRQGFDYPIVPFPINCYGRRVVAQRAACRSLTARSRRAISIRRRRHRGGSSISARRPRASCSNRPTVWRCLRRPAGRTPS